jgi:pimeloyl-ACP methyl ester carboxylesterase
MKDGTKDSVRLTSNTLGDQGAAETVVFLHGLLFSAEMWRPVAEALAQDGYRCLLLNLRGHGGSPVTRSGYDMKTQAEDVKRILRELGVGPCHLVGFSLGGFIALRLAAGTTELKSLVLVSTSADVEPDANRSEYRWLARLVRFGGRRLVIPKVLRIMFSPEHLVDERKKAQATRWLWDIPRLGAYRAALAVIDRESVVEELGRITVPTLVIHAALDKARRREDSEQLVRGITGARLEVVEGAGHMVPVEQPGVVSDFIRDFLATVSAGAGQKPPGGQPGSGSPRP